MASFTNQLLAQTFIVFLVLANTCFAEQNSTLRVVFSNSNSAIDTCPEQGVVNAKINAVKTEIRQLLNNSVIPNLNSENRRCGEHGWTRIISLDMTDPAQQCPSNFRLITSPVRGCIRTTSACDSASFSVNQIYSQVCGKVFAYQYGTLDAFHYSIRNPSRTLEDFYFSGVSLTHGRVGSRQHIWSFVGAISEYTTDSYYDSRRFSQKCSCIDRDLNWPYTTPSFVGNDYFCDSGNHGPGWSYTTYYTGNPMWDGEGCGPRSSCCQFNNPPLFYRTLPQPTNDPIEFRVCGDHNEQSIVYLAEIFVK